jgi:hypothetical protein
MRATPSMHAVWPKKACFFKALSGRTRSGLGSSTGADHNKLAKILLNSKMKKLDPRLKSAQILSRILEVQEKQP